MRIGGKTYNYYNSYMRKADAVRVAKQLRDNEYRARVIDMGSLRTRFGYRTYSGYRWAVYYSGPSMGQVHGRR